MGCGHWLAESPRGATNQLYLALIGALLLPFGRLRALSLSKRQLDLGRRPSKRVWELLQWHLLGLVDDATLAQKLTQQLAAEEQARAKKTKANAQ